MSEQSEQQEHVQHSKNYTEIATKEGVNSKGQPLCGPLDRPPIPEDFPPSFACLFQNSNKN